MDESIFWNLNEKQQLKKNHQLEAGKWIYIFFKKTKENSCTTHTLSRNSKFWINLRWSAAAAAVLMLVVVVVLAVVTLFHTSIINENVPFLNELNMKKKI